jgi:WD40 repeat protein
MPSLPDDKPTLFISYARDDDEPFAKRLRCDLKEHGFSVWWDREAMESRGLTFRQEIRNAIAASDRLVLILGPNARDSRYVEMEWRYALRSGTVVTPLLRLGDRQTSVPEALRALHCEDVRPTIPEEKALKKVRRIVSTPVPPLGRLNGVPSLPSPYLDRPDQLDRLRSRVLIDAYESIDLQPDQRITALTGMGGVGKTTLAAALAQAPDIRRSFPDGIYWITVGRDTDTLQALSRAGRAIGDDAVDRYTGIEEARLLLGKALEKKHCLLMLDDVWNVEVAEALHTAAVENVRILLTSRKRDLFASSGVHDVPVNELSTDDALELLAEWTETPRKELPPEATEVVKECGNLPLAISMIGAIIRKRPNRWGYALERLRQADLSKIHQDIPRYPYKTLDRAMRVSFEDLEPDRQQRYLDFVAVPEDVAAPESMVSAWWTQEGIDELDVPEVLDDLVDRSLLRVDENDAYALHDVQRDFLAMSVEDETALHTRWLAAFESRTSGEWETADEEYLFNHLDHHLRGAGREVEWQELLVSFGWLNRKSRVCGFPAVLQDLAVYSEDRTIGPLYRVCRRAAHILTNDPDQLAAQLLARLETSPALERLLEGAKAWQDGLWLRPVRPSLGEEGEPTLAVFRGREEDGHAGTPRSIAISADSRLIASGGGSSNDLTVKVWSADIEADTGILVRTYEEAVEAGGKTELAFVGPAGRLAAASHDEVRIYVLDAEEPEARHMFEDASISCVCGNEQDDIVYIGLEDGQVVAWNASADTTVTLRDPDDDGVLAVAHASASPRLAIATVSGVECRDSGNGRLIGRLEDTVGHGGFHFDQTLLVIEPDGSRVFFGDPARVWTVGEPAAEVLIGEDRVPVWDVTDEGAIALTAPEDNELVPIEVETGRRLGRIFNAREFSCVALSRNGRLVATGDFEHDVKLWDVMNAEQTPPAWQCRGSVESVAICDDPIHALVSTDGGQEVWETASGTPLQEQWDHASDCLSRRNIPLCDSDIGDQVRERLEQALEITNDETEPWDLPFIERVGPMAFSLPASRAVSATRVGGLKAPDMEEPPYNPTGEAGDYLLYLWDLEDSLEFQLLRGHTMRINCVDMTADGTRAITGSEGRVLRLWDLDTGTCLQTLRGHRGSVYDCALSEDARWAVSGSEDMTLRLWDLTQGTLLFTFAASSAVTACDIARDGSVAMAGEISGRVHTFSVEALPSS